MKSRTAFTLIELLVVIVIVALLAAMLLAGVSAVRRLAKRVQATTEVKGLATALESYFSEYHRWPPSQSLANPPVPDPELNAVPIKGDIVKMLLGDFSTPALLAANPKKMAFMRFKTFAESDTPVNPWWTSGSSSTGCLYYYKVDRNFDNVISVGATPPPATPVRSKTLVWTKDLDSGLNITSMD